MHKNESIIIRMNFYSGRKILLKVGMDNDKYVKKHGGRVEIFEIAADEQLIGAELYHGDY